MLATQTPGSAAPSRLLGASAAELKFRVQGGEHDGRILRIAAAKCTIGSAPGCTLRLRGDGIEPLHCLILSGRNGTIIRRNSPRTYLNGGTFEDAALTTGDVLRVGRVELVVTACPQGAAPAFQQCLQVTQESITAGDLKEKQQRLTGELAAIREELRAAQEQLALAQQSKVEAAAEQARSADQLREQHAKELGLRFAEREATLQQRLDDNLQDLLALQYTLRTQQDQHEQERTGLCGQRQQLADRLADQESEYRRQSSELALRQEASDKLVEQVRSMEGLLQEARQQAQEQQQLEEQQLAEKQCAEEEFAAVRSRLEGSISALTEQLQRREAELGAQQRGGECASTLTIALDDVRNELRTSQIQRNQEEEERTACRRRLEEQAADLTARLLEREQELAHQGGELAELRQRAAQVSAAQQMVQQLEERLATSALAHQSEREAWLENQTELEGCRSQWENAKSDLEAAKSALEARVSAAETLCQELLARCTQSEAQCGSLQAELSPLQSKCAALEAERSEREAQAVIAQEAAAVRCAVMEGQIAQLQADFAEAVATKGVAQRELQEQAAQQLQRYTELETRCGNLQTECDTLKTQCSALEAQRSELESRATLAEQAAAARCEALEGQLAGLRTNLDQDIAAGQHEQWQAEAQTWKLQAEEAAAQRDRLKQLCATLEAEIAGLQGATQGANANAVECQSNEDLRVQLERQQNELAEARAQLEEEQTQLRRLVAETSSREEELARFEAELRAREAAWEAARGEQSGTLEERSQLIASQIAQFEAEQAAFARQQATIIQQMSSLEDRVQELTTASESRTGSSPFIIPQLDDPSLIGGLEPADHPYSRNESTPEPAAEASGAEENTYASKSSERTADSSAPEKAAYVPPSFLDQAAELVWQEELDGIANQTEGDFSQSPAVATQQHAALSAPPGSREDDDSIAQYMSRLLSRARGGTAPDVEAPAQSTMPRAAERLAEPKEYVPLAQAPEQPERLSLMRELANSAANSAIHTHARQHQKRATKQKSFVALLSLIGAGTLFVVACVTGSFTAMIGSLIIGAACCVTMIRAVTGGVRQMRLAPLQEIGDAQEVPDEAQKSGNA